MTHVVFPTVVTFTPTLKNYTEKENTFSISSLTPSSFIKSVDDLPNNCFQLAKLLLIQPTVDGKNFKQCKIVSLNSKQEARICEIFNINTISLIKEKALRIQSFGDKNYPLFDSELAYIPSGIMLCFDHKMEIESLSLLENSYRNILNCMQIGWQLAPLELYSYTKFKENSDLFMLFIKKQLLIDECDLINSLAQHFEVEILIKCYTSWLTKPLEGEPIYLWIKRDSIQRIVRLFGFRF